MWLVTVPNNKESPKTTYSAIRNLIETNSICETNRFEIPGLVVGTLDSLMALSDDLSKIGLQVENVVRKVERQYADISTSKSAPLRVNETSVDTFFKKFQWDVAQFQFQGKQLNELVAQIQSIAGKTEEELKSLTNTYTEKNLALTAAKRRQVINLTSSELEDFLTPEIIAKIDAQNTETLLTVLVVVPKNAEQEFLTSYSDIGAEIASYGGPDWTNSSSLGSNDGKFGPGINRSTIKGSPVVPGSKKKIFEEGDSVLYAITILKGQYSAGYYFDEVFHQGTFVDYLEPLKTAFREKRFIVRELSFDAAKSGGVNGAITEAETEMKQVRASTLRWCKAHFGEVYSAWIHLKIVQAFVESVLRYGLPVDFTAFFLQPDNKREKEMKLLLEKSVLSLRPELKLKKSMVDEEEEDAGTDNLPFVCLRFPMIGTSSDSSSSV